MIRNPLFELQAAGTSVWCDELSRSMLQNEDLQRMIEEDALVGVTSNPTIFEKAIGGSEDYDASLIRQLRAGKSGDELMLGLMVEDIQRAADVLRPIYDRTNHLDGYVSIEVLPELAHDSARTIEMVHDLFSRAGRPNVFVKIPATAEGIPAIERCLSEGININITLIFSRKRYEQVAQAYLNALERRASLGQSLDVASVASFFVSRVDTAVDKRLDERIAKAADPNDRTRLEDLRGKAGIANAKLAYQQFKQIFGGARFRALWDKGAKAQRCLWASTGTKNPRYSDVLYVEELIGPDTVNTMPRKTLAAFKDHGKVRLSLEENRPAAEEAMKGLAGAGIDMDQVTADLEAEGIKLFSESVVKLQAEIHDKVASLSTNVGQRGGRLTT